MDAEVSSPEDFIEPTAVIKNLLSISNRSWPPLQRFGPFGGIRRCAISKRRAAAMPQVAGEGLSDDVKRAIIQTAENTSQLAERARTGGFVFS